ncbi:MAG: DUF4834 family protein [Rikenellaceae bacterium]|nr:DUF4834 family protein [Rikenellaceae bacterium]
MGVLEIILIIVAIFYLLRILAKYLFRRFIRKSQEEFEKRFGGEGGYYKQYTWGTKGSAGEEQKEGEIKITKIDDKQKKVNSQVGDYVEYEEYEETEINSENKNSGC